MTTLAALRRASRALTLAFGSLFVLGACGGGEADETLDSPTTRVGGTAGGESSGGGMIGRGASRTVAGSLRETDPVYQNRGGHHDRYSVTAALGDRLRVIMWSLDFDTYLAILGPNGEEVATDDDGSGTFNAYLEHGIETAGVYTIIATSYSEGATGSYALHVHAAGELPEAVGLEVDAPDEHYEEEGEVEEARDPPVVDQRFTETLTLGGPTTPRGHAFRAFPVFAQAGDTLHVMMRSEDFDTYLHLLDPSGQEVDANDDNPIAGGLNSYIAHAVTMTGQYTVHASSYSSEGTGPYELLIGREVGGGP